MNHTTAGTWLARIEAARSTRDLVAILRDYLDSMTPEQAAQLPRACIAGNVSTVAEIQEWAVTLARDDLKGSGDGALHEAAVVFTAAGAKLPKMAD